MYRPRSAIIWPYLIGTCLAIGLLTTGLWAGLEGGSVDDRRSGLDACRAQVVALRPGTIDRIREWERASGRYYVLQIREPDGTPWLAACDSASGRIVKMAGLDGL